MASIDVVVYGALSKRIKTTETVLESFPSGYTYKGSVETADNLPDDADAGDMYIVTGESNTPYVWNGTEWLNMSKAISTEQIDTLY